MFQKTNGLFDKENLETFKSILAFELEGFLF